MDGKNIGTAIAVKGIGKVKRRLLCLDIDKKNIPQITTTIIIMSLEYVTN